jgi:hypothetical protein
MDPHTFPGKEPFDYTLALDHVLTDYDYVYGKKLNATWMVAVHPDGWSFMKQAAS